MPRTTMTRQARHARLYSKMQRDTKLQQAGQNDLMTRAKIYVERKIVSGVMVSEVCEGFDAVQRAILAICKL